MICYLCKYDKDETKFIIRKDGLRYKMCKVCNVDVQKKKLKNKGRRLHHTENEKNNHTIYTVSLNSNVFITILFCSSISLLMHISNLFIR